ncbi:low temperature requirement protein A [Cellulosimicrobium protaetiae]|uniref:Low temperature requirement protein A n=2 Tax=Cellulosimicrobium protaetiae TaxID=2587808 RepID=A0A6M5UD88_9MICO|nr:low temperature requirement protein A [Cellulosimicrobium protaetiae]
MTMFEIFFDLVFVFALMRVIALMEEGPGAVSLGRGLLLLLLLWWAWSAFIWLGNRVRLDRGAVVGAVLAAMTALFVAALVIPSAWDAHHGPWGPALVLALAITVVRAAYVSAFLWSARGDGRLRTQVLIDLAPQSASCVLLVVGAVLGGTAQGICWALAFALDFGVGWLLSRYNGWRVASPAHFVERHGLVLIIALGETVLSAGSGLPTADGGPTLPTLGVGTLGFAVVVGLWWTYFRGPSASAHEALSRAGAARRPALARDGYTLGHLPLVAGVVYVALGTRLLLDDVLAAPGAPARTVAVLALTGGLACYYGGLGLFPRVMGGRWGRVPVVAAAVTVVLGVVALAVPAFATLVVTAVLVGTAALAVQHGEGAGARARP